MEVYEAFDSRATQLGDDVLQATLKYFVVGTMDDAEAGSAALSASPATYGGILVRKGISYEPLAIDAWGVTVNYVHPARDVPPERSDPKAGDQIFSFDTGGGTAHISQSLETVNRYSARGEPPDFGGAIGVTEDAIEGTDIVVPVFQFNQTAYFALEAVDWTYRKKVFELTGCVNQFPFATFAAGEVLFLGAAGSLRARELWELNFKFAASPNFDDLVIGSMTGIEKDGWDYLWVRYGMTKDEAAGAIVRSPSSVHIERVYRRKDLSELNIVVA